MDDESETVLIVNVISPGRSTDLEPLSSAHGTLVPSRSVWVVVTQCIWVICPPHVLLGLQHSCTLAQMVHFCHYLCHSAISNQRRKQIQYFQICRSVIELSNIPSAWLQIDLWKGTWNAVALARPSDKHCPIKCDVVNENDTSRRAQMHSIYEGIHPLTWWGIDCIHKPRYGGFSLLFQRLTLFCEQSHMLWCWMEVSGISRKKEICDFSSFGRTQWLCSWVLKKRAIDKWVSKECDVVDIKSTIRQCIWMPRRSSTNKNMSKCPLWWVFTWTHSVMSENRWMKIIWRKIGCVWVYKVLKWQHCVTYLLFLCHKCDPGPQNQS